MTGIGRDDELAEVIELRPAAAYFGLNRVPRSAIDLEYERRVRAARAYDRDNPIASRKASLAQLEEEIGRETTLAAGMFELLEGGA